MDQSEISQLIEALRAQTDAINALAASNMALVEAMGSADDEPAPDVGDTPREGMGSRRGGKL